ncbi:MAG: hypothetical protein WBB69_00805 [Anaerolineales bacterium]
MRRRIGFSLLLLHLVSACGMSNADLQATTTQVAAELYGTQTALAPTEISSLDRTAAATDVTSPTLAVEEAVWISRPTATPRTVKPLPPGIEPQLLCYKAAALIYADWAVHDSLLHPYRPRNNFYGPRESIIPKINEFNWYREQSKDRIIIDKGEASVLNDVKLYFDKTYYLDGEELNHCEHIGDILFSQEYLGNHPWMPEGLGVNKRAPGPFETSPGAVYEIERSMATIARVMTQMRYQLLVDSEIDYSHLIEVERPIWQKVLDRYGVAFPNYLQGKKAEQ